jgi:hypothetical protein
MSAITKEQRVNVLQALNWNLSYEQSKSEKVTVISFGPFREFEKSFISPSNALFFRDYLRSLGVSHDIIEHGFDDYGKVR